MKTTFTALALATTLLFSAFSANANHILLPKEYTSEAESYVLMSRTSSVDAYDTDKWTLTLCAGTSYRIIVDGDGDTDLDAHLYDENGNLIDKDVDNIDYCILDVSPKWTGKFELRVKNYGGVYNRYKIDVKVL